MMPNVGGWLSKEEMVFQRMEHFHRQRIEQIESEPGDLNRNDGGMLVVHMLPQESVERRVRFAAAELQTYGIGIQPFGEEYGKERFNADGYRRFSSKAYSQLFRDGCLEAMMCNVKIDVVGTKTIRIGACEQALLKIVPAYLAFCKSAELHGPVWAFAALLGCDQARVRLEPQWSDYSEFPIDRSPLFLPEAEITSLDASSEEVLRPLCDAIWQACGIERSPNFGNDGKWRPRR